MNMLKKVLLGHLKSFAGPLKKKVLAGQKWPAGLALAGRPGYRTLARFLS
jgi:hypothetical protein